ncbi:MAG: thioether cross-link-forming SCIFF peptide maturase [Clostridiales bacterium]|nr:thioether cross-link-forming SCIFF peptide maturase [Clostridiales bacterium]
MIHKYKFKDKHIVLDVNSGAVHVVEKIIYDILDVYNGENKEEVFVAIRDKYDESSVHDAVSDLDYLISHGLLFSDDSHITDEIIHNKKPVVKALCLHISHDCNMNCRYCFGDQGAFEGIRELMSFEVGKKAIDFLVQNSGSRRNLEVDFFGGEPLMNFDVVKALVHYGKTVEKTYRKNIRFTITTNGLLLDDEKIDYINEHMDNIILSIDGRPEIHDKMRRTWNDKGTYDLIIKNYHHFVQKRKDALYYVRGTFTKENLDFSEDLIHLINQGFKNVSIEPVVVNDNISYALREDDLDSIFNEYEKLSDYYIQEYKNGKAFEFFHFNLDLDQGPCIIKRISGCGAGTEYMAIAPNGDIYPCHQFVGNKDFLLGNINENCFENRLYDTFNKAHIFNKEKCKSCWAKFYCSGGCHANAYNINGSIYEPYELGCEMEKKRIECAIGIQAALTE